MKIISKFIVVLVFAGLASFANAAMINITTNSTITSQPSYTFGDWIFELVNPTNLGFNLVDSSEDFIVSNFSFGQNFTLRRLDNNVFSLLGVRIAGGGGNSTIGGVGVPSPGSQVWQDFAFSGQAGVTNVNVVLLVPNVTIQLSSFEVEDAANVSTPATFALVGFGLASLGWLRRKKA